MSAEENESGSTPAEVIEIVGKTGMHGEAMQVKCRIKEGENQMPMIATRAGDFAVPAVFALLAGFGVADRGPPFRRNPHRSNRGRDA